MPTRRGYEHEWAVERERQHATRSFCDLLPPLPGGVRQVVVDERNVLRLQRGVHAVQVAFYRYRQPNEDGDALKRFTATGQTTADAIAALGTVTRLPFNRRVILDYLDATGWSA